MFIGGSKKIIHFKDIMNMSNGPLLKSNVETIVGRMRGKEKRIVAIMIKGNKKVEQEIPLELSEDFEKTFVDILTYIITIGSVPYSVKKKKKQKKSTNDKSSDDGGGGQIYQPYVPNHDFFEMEYKRDEDSLEYTCRLRGKEFQDKDIDNSGVVIITQPKDEIIRIRQVNAKEHEQNRESLYGQNRFVDEDGMLCAKGLVPQTPFYHLYKLRKKKNSYWQINKKMHQLNTYNSVFPITKEEINPSYLQEPGHSTLIKTMAKKVKVQPIDLTKYGEFNTQQILALTGVSRGSFVPRVNYMNDLAVVKKFHATQELFKQSPKSFGLFQRPIFNPPLKPPVDEIKVLTEKENNYIIDIFGFSSNVQRSTSLSKEQETQVDSMNQKLKHYAETLSEVITVIYKDMIKLSKRDDNIFKDNDVDVRLEVQYTPFLSEAHNKIIMERYQVDPVAQAQYYKEFLNIDLPKVDIGKSIDGNKDNGKKRKNKVNKEVKEIEKDLTEGGGKDDPKDGSKKKKKKKGKGRNPKKRGRDEDEQDKEDVEKDNPKKKVKRDSRKPNKKNKKNKRIKK